MKQRAKLRFFLSGGDIGGNSGNVISDVFGKFGVVLSYGLRGMGGIFEQYATAELGKIMQM